MTAAGSALCMLSACGAGGQGSGIPTVPSVAPPASLQLAGQAIGALDAHGVAGVKVAPEKLTAVTADANGFFTVQGAAGVYTSTISGPDVFDRQTALALPGANARFSLIPRSFDLNAFDQMFRTSGSHLQRWTKAPSLVVVAVELVFTTLTDSGFTASSRRMTDTDVTSVVGDVSWGLPQLTGDTFQAFASTSSDVAIAGATVGILRDGAIVVARYQGLTIATGYQGFGRWATLGDGTVTAGVVFLDADFDRSATDHRALRVHETGHALGYSHVLARTSIMNAAPAIAPTLLDVEAARVAFQRAPGSRSPDVDPASSLVNQSVRPATWGPAIP